MIKLLVTAAIAILTFITHPIPVLADPVLPLPDLPILGDQDGSEAPLVFNAPGFEPLTNVQVFSIAKGGQSDVTFDFVFREAKLDNEFGFFVADSFSGQVDNLRPGDPGYLAAALERAEVVFPSGSTAFTADVTRAFNGGEFLIFFIIQNSTLEKFVATNPTNNLSRSPRAFFSLDLLNSDACDHFVGFRNVTDDITQFGFEDETNCGDQDYNDIVYNVETILHPVNIAPIADAGAFYSAMVGEQITFSGTDSFDPDGSITLYEWDFESDGTFDVSSTDPTAVYRYRRQLSGTATLRVTDNDENIGTDTAVVEIQAIPPDWNVPPIADAGTFYSATVGKLITFDGGDSFDPDGSIVRYEWDFESDGAFDISATDPTATHRYHHLFSGMVTLRVTDNDGNVETDTTAVEITAAAGTQQRRIFLPMMAH